MVGVHENLPWAEKCGGGAFIPFLNGGAPQQCLLSYKPKQKEALLIDSIPSS